ncbi:alpha/beta fold hydrolase [Glaciibacter superstes]|uniref:alpha/beta fold hydrolase n=1 Tax=Glaciibacter superstes TaxID=501023 RepID=UPI0003B42EE4|nr:alpha/beta hydrolase [Glaciibacter superstes]
MTTFNAFVRLTSPGCGAAFALAALLALTLSTALTGCTGLGTPGSLSADSTAGTTRPPVEAGSPLAGEFAGRIPIGDGRELYLQCAGEGEPTVVLESGIHDSSDTWTISDSPAAPVFTEVSTYAHVCMYDRPGTIRYSNPPELTTRSTPVDMPRTLSSMVSDLNALMTEARIPGPYLFVGHSYGGMIVRSFAQTHPSSTAGVVFVDAFGPNIADKFGEQWPAYAAVLNKPGTALDEQPGWETVDADEAILQIVNGGQLPDVPAAVISKTEPFAVAPTVPSALTETLERAWPHVQEELVALRPNTPHAFATGSDHYVQIHDPDLTSSMIRLVLERSQTNGTS